MLTNERRKEILETARAVGYKGSVLDLFDAARAGQDISQMLQPQDMQVANTPQEQSQGLRPQHAAGNTNASMAFPDVPPNTPFSTEGMKAPINISKFDDQGHLVQSFKNVPPGIQSLPTGPGKGTVIETPAYKKGGYRAKHQTGSFKDRLFPPKVQQMHNNLEPAIYDGMLDEVTVTPYTQSEYAWEEQMRNKATGRLTPTYPVFDAMTLGLKPAATAATKSIRAGIKNAPAKINPRYFKPSEDLWYRQVGKSAIDDIAESKVIRERGEDILNSQKVYNDRVLRMKGIDPNTGKPFANYETAAAEQLLGSRRPKSPYFQKGELYWGWNRKPGKGKIGRGGDADSEYLIESLLDDGAFHPAHVKGMFPDTPDKWVGDIGILKPRPKLRDPANFNLYKRNWWSGYKPIKKQEGGYRAKFQPGGVKDGKVGEQSILPPAIRNMYPEEDPINYGGMLAETTVTAPRAKPPGFMDYVNYRRQAGEAIPESSPYHHSHSPEPINTNFTFMGVDRSSGLSALRGLAKGIKKGLGLIKGKGAKVADEAVSGFNYKKGLGNPYENLNVTDDTFKGRPFYGVDYDGQIAKGRLDFVRNLGRELDDAKFDANWVAPEHLRFHGTPGGRSVVEVAVPGKTHQSQLFYKSTALGGKSGEGVKGTTQGLWQPYGGHATLLDSDGPITDWFIKDIGYKNYYNSKSFRDISNRLDDLTKEAGFDMSGQRYKYQKGGYRKKYQFGGREGEAFQEVDTYIKPGQSTRPNWAQTPDAVTNYTFGKNLINDESRFSLGLQGTDILDEIKYRGDLIANAGIGIGNRKGKSFRPAGENLRAGVRGQASWQGVPGNVVENMFPRSGVDVRGSFEGEAGLAYANGAVSPYMSVTPQTNFSLNDNLHLGVGYEMRGRYDKNRDNPIYGSTGTGTVAPLSQRDAYSGMGRGAGRLSLKYDMGDGDFIEGYYSKPNSLYQGSMYPAPGVIALENEGPRFGVRLKKSF